jgi:hypothetical protein
MPQSWCFLELLEIIKGVEDEFAIASSKGKTLIARSLYLEGL